MDNNVVIKGEAAGEVVVKKSRFIAALKFVETTAEADTYIKDKKKQYHDARHNCSCYIVEKGAVSKSSDDGEPSGTAGRPMLEVLEGAGITNVVCVVTRYFGGVLLGTGGLVRAYQDAVKAALENATLLKTITVNALKVTVDYNQWPLIEKLCRENNISMEDTAYTENVTSRLMIPIADTDRIVSDIIELTGAKATIVRDEAEYTIFSD